MITYVIILTFTCADGTSIKTEKLYKERNSALSALSGFKDGVGTMLAPDREDCKLDSLKAGHRTMKEGKFL